MGDRTLADLGPLDYRAMYDYIARNPELARKYMPNGTGYLQGDPASSWDYNQLSRMSEGLRPDTILPEAVAGADFLGKTSIPRLLGQDLPPTLRVNEAFSDVRRRR